MTPWFLAAIVIGTSAWHWGHGPELGADDHGQYLLHARALVEGRPYTDIGFIHSSFTTLIAPVAEPPGLPLVIAAVFAMAGESLPWVRALLVLSFVLFALIVWRYWRRLEGDAIALVVAAWSVVALIRLHVVDTVLADLPFAAALWLTFTLADAPNSTRSAIQYGAMALAGGLAFSFRMAALPLLPAIVCFAFVRPRSERRALTVVAGVWALSAIGVLYLLPGGTALGSEVARASADILRDVALNARATLEGARHWMPISLPWRAANVAMHGVLLLIAALGAIVALREQPRRLAYLTAAWYLAMLVALPTRAARYMWPLYPLLSFAFIRGAQWLVQRGRVSLGARTAPPAMAAAGALLTLGLLQDARAAAPRTLRGDPETQEIVAALSYAAQEATVRAVFFSPRVLAWETRITATAFGAGAPEAMYRALPRLGVTHLALGDAGTHAQGSNETAQMVAAHRESFVPVLANRSFVLYRVYLAGDSTR